MSRTCTICTHADRTAIEAALVAGEPYRAIAKRFQVSHTAPLRHKADHLPAALLRSKEATDEAAAVNVMGELRRCLDRVNRLSDACHEWLQDANDPSRYCIGPRAGEIDVTYYVTGERRGKPKKAKLQDLLARAVVPDGEERPLLVEAWETKHADPRELLLKTSAQLNRQLTLVAKLLGELAQDGATTVQVSPEWLRVKSALLTALQPYPDARTAVLRALSSLESGQ